MSRKEIIARAREIRRLTGNTIKLSGTTASIATFIADNTNGNFDVIHTDILYIIASMLDAISFMRLVAACPRLARHVAQNIARYQALFTAHDRYDKYHGTFGSYLCDRLHSFDDNPALAYGNTRIWYKYGLKHRNNDLPAYETYNTSIWYQNDIICRLSGNFNYRKDFDYSWIIDAPRIAPHFLKYTREYRNREFIYDDSSQFNVRLIGGLRTIDDMSAFILTHYSISFYNGTKSHRDIYPALIVFDDAHRKRTWYENGRVHRPDDMPAYLVDSETDNTDWTDVTIRDNQRSVKWFQYGQLFRFNGPAVIYRGEPDCYFINGIQQKSVINTNKEPVKHS